MKQLLEVIAQLWNYKFSLVPVLTAYAIFEIPSIIRRMMRWYYTPIYFAFFPLGHSDKLYAQYLNEDTWYFPHQQHTPEQKKALRNYIVSIAIISMAISTVIVPLVIGALCTFFLSRSVFLEFLWFLMTVKTILIIKSLNKLRFTPVIFQSKSLPLLVLLYATYLLTVWKFLLHSFNWTSTQMAAGGFVAIAEGLIEAIIFEAVVGMALVSAVTWAVMYRVTNPSLIREHTPPATAPND